MKDLPFTFARNTGSRGDRVVDRAKPDVEYGVVWRHVGGPCRWVAEYPGDKPGNGGGVPGFATREWAGFFLYRYNKPNLSDQRG
ncbi:hypothetical protein [Streptomyces noursei]|uniref:Uncharacterized protein n=1 Tax=Streptomyces noursei TaxID=1971 RepID=A0A2N8PQT8_STRNR|nr:hypothetical protein [Streptomyces noursei]PNE43395.1 hypothetical protein AOB60_00145 [Streptomyces noursei]